jgi:hypothetical protein
MMDMGWKNAYQLVREYRSSDFRKRFADLYTLRLFLRDSIVEPAYAPSPALAEAVALSPTGQEVLSCMQESATQELPARECRVALLLVFFHHDLLVDLDHTEYSALYEALHQDIAAARIRYPWIYGRCLYDRFFDMYPSRTKTLSYEETRKLLDGTPQGVFQVLGTVAGPLGLLRSSCSRELPPNLDAPMWHCSDPSCNAIHPVRMTSGRTAIAKISAAIRRVARRLYGDPASQWDVFFWNTAGFPDYYDDWHPGTLPWLLANSFSESEIRAVLASLLETNSEDIRDRIPKTRRMQAVFRGSPEKVAAKLSGPQCFQLLLLASDEAIASSVEDLVENKRIEVPPTELRTPVFWIRRTWANIVWECSQFGLRAVPKKTTISPIRLANLIRELYAGDEQREQLAWTLRHVDGDTMAEKLDRYLSEADPRDILRDTVLSGQNRIERAFSLLKYGRFSVPATREDEEWLISKILWKLGFNIGLYPQYQSRFWKRHATLLQAARTCTDYDEREKESVRSAGANFFVSLEEVLDYSLSFVTWVLLSDHYGSTKFKCNLDQARRSMASQLSARAPARAESLEPLEFDPEGVNTLYPLVQGFSLLADVCQEKLEGDSAAFVRPLEECPGYHLRSHTDVFPFRHTTLLLDLQDDDRNRIIHTLRGLTAKMDQAQVCSIRNRMQHRRREHEFPSQDEIESVCSSTGSVVAEMEESGVCPSIYLHAGTFKDRYGRTAVTLRDYKGREVTLHEPSPYSRANPTSFDQPVIVVPWIRIPGSSEPIRFRFEEESEYTELWRGYPKRRTRAADTETEPQRITDRTNAT